MQMQVDFSTFNNNLPEGNDRVPQLQIPMTLGNQQNVVAYVVACFRKALQDGAQNSPVHILAYNTISSNWFQNQYYQQWCQKAVDFTAVMMNQQAGDSGVIYNYAKTVAEAFIGFIWGQYRNQMYNQVNPNFINNFDQAFQRYQQLEQNLNAVKQGAVQQNSYGVGNSYGMPMNNNMNNVMVSQQASSNYTSPAMSTQGTSANVSSEGIYATIQEFDTTTHQTAVNSGQVPQGTVHMNAYTLAQTNQENAPESVVETPTLPTPEEIDIVGNAFGDRPFDEVSCGHGIRAVPTVLHPDLAITKREVDLFKVFYDRNKLISFTLKYPDGNNYIKLLEWEPEMDYLKHELNDEYKRRYGIHNDKGLVKSRDIDIVEYNENSISNKTDMKLAVSLKDNLDEVDGLPMYVITETVFSGGTDMEVERIVEEYLLNEILENKFDKIPTHEYMVIKNHSLDVDKPVFDKLSTLTSYMDLSAVATYIKEMLRTGELSVRNFNFINERLTNTINDFIKDSLSDETTMDSFCQDISDLFDYYNGNGKSHYTEAIKSNVNRILHQSVNIMEVDESDYAIIDEFVNLQTHWNYSDLTLLNLNKGETALLSMSSNKTLINVLQSSVKRHRETKPFVKFRLITKDGVYLELVKGALVEGSNLLKRI